MGTATGLVVLLYACGGDDRNFGDGGGGNGGDAGNGGATATGGKSNGGTGAGAGRGGSDTGGSNAGGAGGVDAGGNDAGGNDAGGNDAGGGNAGGMANDAGAGGDVIDVEPGRPGSALVSGGNVMTSAKYRLVLTTGEGPGGTQVLSSTNYKLIGGLIGTTEH